MTKTIYTPNLSTLREYAKELVKFRAEKEHYKFYKLEILYGGDVELIKVSSEEVLTMIDNTDDERLINLLTETIKNDKYLSSLSALLDRCTITSLIEDKDVLTINGVKLNSRHSENWFFNPISKVTVEHKPGGIDYDEYDLYRVYYMFNSTDNTMYYSDEDNIVL